MQHIHTYTYILAYTANAHTSLVWSPYARACTDAHALGGWDQHLRAHILRMRTRKRTLAGGSFPTHAPAIKKTPRLRCFTKRWDLRRSYSHLKPLLLQNTENECKHLLPRPEWIYVYHALYSIALSSIDPLQEEYESAGQTPLIVRLRLSLCSCEWFITCMLVR